jgi:ubiquinone/menaquinone biosynthesis C-methylase UbiE
MVRALVRTAERARLGVSSVRDRLLSEADGALHVPTESPADRALGWIRAHEQATGGVLVHHRSRVSYPEVSGYIVPTLVALGETDLAVRVLKWLICVQRPDGSFPDPDHSVPHVFDTGQALRGLLAGIDLVPSAAESARRAAECLCRAMVQGGREGFGDRYGGTIPEPIHLYVLPPLTAAAAIFDAPAYRVASERCIDYYAGRDDFLRIGDLTHFVAYQIEALIDLGRFELAEAALSALRTVQEPDGAVRGRGGVSWVCTPGLAQLAICWYKVNQPEPADRAMLWLERHQRRSGGFLGSYGPGATYFPTQEPSWAPKYYLDAHRLRARSRTGHDPQSAEAVAAAERALPVRFPDGDTVLHVGSGPGRVLDRLGELFPDRRYTGVDPAVEAPGRPGAAATIRSDLERLPFADERFDAVVATDALLRSSNTNATLREMLRVLRSGGSLVVAAPERASIELRIHRHCSDVSASTIPGERSLRLYRGCKRSPLTGGRPSPVLAGATTRRALVERMSRNEMSPWGQEIMLLTHLGERVIGIGSGTGEASLALARSGRQVTVSDVSTASLAPIVECADDLGIALSAVGFDALGRLPFPDGSFDCAWSAGLFEYLPSAERQARLREMARVAPARVVVLVPNAASLPYRLGKDILEESGRWRSAGETPLLSLVDDLRAAGLETVDEYSVAPRAALELLPARHLVRRTLAAWMAERTDAELDSANQGYLLVTVGRAASGAV